MFSFAQQDREAVKKKREKEERARRSLANRFGCVVCTLDVWHGMAWYGMVWYEKKKHVPMGSVI